MSSETRAEQLFERARVAGVEIRRARRHAEQGGDVVTAALALRVGLLNTMVLTHVPSNLLLILVPFMPTLPLAVAVLLMRFSVSQMDVPARQSYTAAVVDPDERSAAAGIAGVARTTGAALSPVLAGVFLGTPALAGAPFVVAGGLKLLYDGLLYRLFRGRKYIARVRLYYPGESGKTSLIFS